MSQTVELALQQAAFYSDDQLYTLVHLPPAAITAAASVLAQIGEPFAALIADKDEVTLLISSEALAEFSSHLPGHNASLTAYRLITIDVALEPSLVGFIAHVSRALAVSILPFAAYTRDHILVASDQFSTALAALEKLKTQIKT